MYEDFAFTRLPNIDPATTYVLCNEVSDHQPFYMWGRVARQFLMLPTQGYHIATSIHADTIDDTIYMFHHELRMSSDAVRRLDLVVHTGIVDQICLSTQMESPPHAVDGLVPILYDQHQIQSILRPSFPYRFLYGTSMTIPLNMQISPPLMR